MHAAIARHDEILHKAIRAHGGTIVKMTGDGAHAAFATAHAAIAAAIDAQLGLAGESWGLTGALRVRVGVHTGPAEQRAGDYFGATLNRAARLTNVAHGGQIVVSQATADLARDELPGGCELVDLGEHRLRDLSRPERVYQVAGNGLERDFPRLRSSEAFPGNLLRAGDVVRGQGRGARGGGQGVARGPPRHALGSGRGGQDAPGDPDDCRGAARQSGRGMAVRAGCGGRSGCHGAGVAAALGVQSYPGVALDARVREVLRDGRVLLVLDNCEHLLDAVSRLAEGVLRDCPRVRILATSREPLDIGGERVVRVRSLPMRDLVAEGEEGGESDAVRLFVDERPARNLTSNLTKRTLASWRTSVGVSTGFRWRSSSRRRGWSR
jgi:Adenylate and Guanylate cyclase catalytic domain